jgi:hypothetical protein
MSLQTLKKHPVLDQGSQWAITGYLIDRGKHKRFVEGSWVVKAKEQFFDIHIILVDTESKRMILERDCHGYLNTSSGINNWSEHRLEDGFFQGQINMVDDTLLLQLESDQGFRSIESLLRVFEKEYEVRGVMLKNNQNLGSWVLELLRIN